MTRRALLIGAVAVVVVAAVGAVLLGARDSNPEAEPGPSPLAQAIAITDDQPRFATSSTAGDSFAAVANLLLAETQRCSDFGRRSSPPCVAISQGAAVAESASVLARKCAADGVAGMRASLRSHLVAISGPIRTERDLPAVPRLPRCA